MITITYRENSRIKEDIPTREKKRGGLPGSNVDAVGEINEIITQRKWGEKKYETKKAASKSSTSQNPVEDTMGLCGKKAIDPD